MSGGPDGANPPNDSARPPSPGGLLVVLAGPSGVGKSTVCTALAERAPDTYSLSLSATTRPPRPSEVDGKHYRFCARDQFDRLRDDDELLEHNEYQGHGYGTPRDATLNLLSAGRVVLLDIDVNGALQLRDSGLPLLLVMVTPPSFEALAGRIRGRSDGLSEEQIEGRLAHARHELAQRKWFDHVVVNDDLERAVDEIEALIAARRGRGADAARRAPSDYS